MSDTLDTTRLLDPSKRDFMKKTTGLSVAAALMAMVPPGVRQGAWAAGSDAPEKPNLNIGFIPLTDCASVVMASVKGFDKKYGLTITPSKEASWAAVRDKLVNGELDAAHVLYGLIYGVQLGIGGPKKDMAVLATLNNNGQAITLSNQLKAKGVTDGASLAKLVKAEPREYTFAQTFPTGTHAMWLYYWLAAYGIDPVPRRQEHRRAAAADGRQHARRQHGRLLRRRAVERARDPRQHRLHRRDHAGNLEGPSGKSARHHRRIRREVSQHRARHGGGDPRRVEVHRRHEEPLRSRQGHLRQVLRQHRLRLDRGPHARPVRQRQRQEVGRTPTT